MNLDIEIDNIKLYNCTYSVHNTKEREITKKYTF